MNSAAPASDAKALLVISSRSSRHEFAARWGAAGDAPVVSVSSPQSALEAMLGPGVEIAAVDLASTDFDGHDLLAIARSHEYSRRLPGVPVIALAGDDARARARALSEGFLACVDPVSETGVLAVSIQRARELRAHTVRNLPTVDLEGILGKLVGATAQGGAAGPSQILSGWTLAVESNGREMLHDCLLAAYHGDGPGAAAKAAMFAGMARAVHAAQLAFLAGELSSAAMSQDLERLERTVVLARAELDRIAFALRDEVQRKGWSR